MNYHCKINMHASFMTKAKIHNNNNNSQRLNTSFRSHLETTFLLY